MEREYWENVVRPVVEGILRNSKKYENKERCFLTAYQIANLVKKQNSDIGNDFSIGGKGAGTNTLAQRIAWYLSDEQDDFLGYTLDRHFLSIEGLDELTFDKKWQPSNNEFSMYRLRDNDVCSESDTE